MEPTKAQVDRCKLILGDRLAVIEGQVVEQRDEPYMIEAIGHEIAKRLVEHKHVKYVDGFWRYRFELIIPGDEDGKAEQSPK